MQRRGIAWAAGLFEGEGTIVFREHDRRPSRELDLQLSSTDEDVVREFHRVVKHGKVYGPYQYGIQKSYWKWYVYGDKALEILRRLGPYLCSRRTERKEYVECRLS